MIANRYLFRAVLGLGLWLSTGAAQALIISEYVEGSSNNKAIEITNLEAGSTRWTGVELRVYSNGSSTPTTLVALGDLDLMPGQSYVVAHSSAAATLTARAQRTVGGTWFNGNDAVELRVAGARRDLLGQIGTDPDPAVTVGWSGGGVQTVDRSLRRRASVCTGVLTSPASFNPSTQWTAAARDERDLAEQAAHLVHVQRVRLRADVTAQAECERGEQPVRDHDDHRAGDADEVQARDAEEDEAHVRHGRVAYELVQVALAHRHPATIENVPEAEQR